MSLELLPIDDPRWDEYRGGYNLAVSDLRPFLRKLTTGVMEKDDWNVLWDDLHHQGDVGEASYAVVPYLARYARVAPVISYHAFAFPAVVELARNASRNPSVPDELAISYQAALAELPGIALERGPEAWDGHCFEAVMALLALSLGRRVHAEAYLELTEKEIPEFFKALYGASE